MSQKTCLGACLPAAASDGKGRKENIMRNRKTLLAAAALMIVAALMAGPLVLHQAQTQVGRQDCGGGVGSTGDESAKEFTYHTDAEYLGQVLVEEKLVKGESSQFGLYITTVDGETAQESENQWWRVTQDGEMVNTGVDTTPVQDGDHFELTLSTY